MTRRTFLESKLGIGNCFQLLNQDAQSSEMLFEHLSHVFNFDKFGQTLSYFQGGSSSSCLEAGANVVGGGWRWLGAGWLVASRERLERQLAAGSRGIDPGLTRLDSLPQWWQGADGQWSSYPCVSTLSPSNFNCSILNFSSAFPVMLPIKP